jgi:hypothetical protein
MDEPIFANPGVQKVVVAVALIATVIVLFIY